MGWGSHLGSCPVHVRGSCPLRVRVRVWARVRVRVWFVFGSRLGSCLVRVYFVSGLGIGSEFVSYLFYIWVVLDIIEYDIFISYIKYLDSKISRNLV